MTEQRFRMGRREHQYVSDRLSAYVDGELGAKERARVETHLGVCEDCRADLRTLRWTKSLLRQVGSVKAPRSFVIREADVEARRPLRGRAFLFATQWATAIVALLLVLVVGGDLLVGGRFPAGQRMAAPILTSQEVVVTVTRVVVEAETAGPEQERMLVEPETPVQPEEGARAMPEATLAPDVRAEKAAPELQAEGIGAGGAVTPTDTAPMMMAQPEAATAVTDTPAAEVMLAQPGAAVPAPSPPDTEGENVVPEKEEMPTAGAAPSERDDATAVWSSEEEPGAAIPQPERGFVSRDNVRLAWRVAEIVLGIALVCLLVAVFWLRRQG